MLHQSIQCVILAMAMLVLAGCEGLTRPRNSNPTDARLSGRVRAILASAPRPQSPQPSHERLWSANVSVLPYAEIHADRVHLHNIRDTYYRTELDCDVRHFDQVIYLADIVSMDFIVVPFKNAPALAHTMISFGLVDGQHIGLSVEARFEKGESYQPFKASTQGYELIYVLATERDLIGLRSSIRKDDVYLYRTTAQPEHARQVFLAAVARINEIARRPEFYDILTNNCTTNLFSLVNNSRPGTVQEDIRVWLPGHSDKMLYDQGLIQAFGPFELVRQASRINLAANLHYGSSKFSSAIRGQLNSPDIPTGD